MNRQGVAGRLAVGATQSPDAVPWLSGSPIRWRTSPMRIGPVPTAVSMNFRSPARSALSTRGWEEPGLDDASVVLDAVLPPGARVAPDPLLAFPVEPAPVPAAAVPVAAEPPPLCETAASACCARHRSRLTDPSPATGHRSVLRPAGAPGVPA